MRSAPLAFFWTLPFVLGFSGALPAAEPAAVHKVLFVGLDGTRFDALRAAQAPTLHRLLEQGTWSDRTRIQAARYRDSDTVSGPGWSSLLTGVWADKHGVRDNSFRGRNLDVFPHFFHRLKQARPASRTASIVNWPQIHDYIVRAADVSLNLQPQGTKPLDWLGADHRAADEACRLLKDPALDCLFLYFGQIDETGHEKGFHPTVPEYLASIARVDRFLDRVLKAIRDRPTYARENWLVLVSADHGGRGRDHSKGQDVPEINTVFLILHGPSVRPGKLEGETAIVDLPVTALAHLGVPALPAWKLDGRSLLDPPQP